MIGGPGRPLRFLALMVAGWIGLRTVMLWPHAQAAAERERMPRLAQPAAAARPASAPDATPAPLQVAALWRTKIVTVAARRSAVGSVRLQGAPAWPSVGRAGVADQPPPSLIPGLPRPVPPAVSVTTGSPARPPLRRLSGSFWLVARGSGGIASAPLGGQLGGSQVGLRLAYLLDRRRRIAVAARVTSPLGSGLREAAIGLEWQPTRLPVRVVAEQRIALSSGKGGPAVGVVGGFGPDPIGSGFRLEGYGQAGAIHRDRTEGFVDGAAHVSHPLVTIGAVPIDLGAGLWGGAQRGAERLDIGPSLTATLPIAGRNARLSLDWRERVAGRARPGSGIALTLGADF